MPVLHIQAIFKDNSNVSEPIVIGRQIPNQAMILTGYRFSSSVEIPIQKQVYIKMPFISNEDVTSSVGRHGHIPILATQDKARGTIPNPNDPANPNLDVYHGVLQQCQYEFQTHIDVPPSFTAKLYAKSSDFVIDEPVPLSPGQNQQFCIDLYFTYYKYNTV